MKKKIIIEIQYEHDEDCKYLDTHDNWDCGCGAFRQENEKFIAEQKEK